MDSTSTHVSNCTMTFKGGVSGHWVKDLILSDSGQTICKFEIWPSSNQQ